MKALLKKMLSFKLVNLLVRLLLKACAPIIPSSLLARVPIVGTVSLRLIHKRRILVDGLSAGSLRMVYWKGLKGVGDPALNLLPQLLKNTRTFVDVGANVGLFSLVAALDNPETKVWAFEPEPMAFSALKGVLDMNSLHNVIPVNAAVTNLDGTTTLFVPYEYEGDSIPVSGSTLSGFRNNCTEVTVPAVTLDSFFSKTPVDHIDLIKVDTEATEHLVLQGAADILMRDEPIIICEVLKGRTEEALSEVLGNTDYRYFLITRNGLVEKSHIEGRTALAEFNHLFVTPAKLPLVEKLVRR